MRTPARSTVALSAALAVCLAAPVAEAAKPDAAKHGNANPAATALIPPADPCGYGAPSKVFSPWNDNKNYVLAENGGLEAGDTGWTLAPSAALVAGNETFFLHGTGDVNSLSLPAGSSATSPATCVTSAKPMFRLMARTSGNRDSRLKVEVLYLGADNKKRSAVARKLRAGEAWKPTKKLAVRLGHAKLNGPLNTAQIALRFTPVGSGDWQIDDLYLDPRARA